LVKTQPTPFRRARLAEAYVQSGDFAKAEREADELLREDPSFVAAYNARAASKIRQYELSGFGNDQHRLDAVAALRKSLSLNGNQPAIEKQLREYESASAIKP
jgi:tetratricopeptide (TPR) repeat protein